MRAKAYRIIMYIASLIAALGLISFIGGIKAVNIGAFVFPALVAIWAFYNYRKGKKQE